MIRHKNILVFIVFFLLFKTPCNASTEKKLVLIVVDTAALEDFLKVPSINYMAKNGVLGLVNTRSVGKNDISKSALTFGSGTKSDTDFTMSDIYMSDNGNIRSRHIEAIKNINAKTLYSAIPGKLGSILKNNGLRTGFVGGEKYGDSIKAPAFFIGMDEHGVVDFGDIDVLHNNTDFSKILEKFNLFYSRCNFLTININNNNIKDFNSLKNMELFIQAMLKRMNFSNSAVCVLSTFTSHNKIEDLSSIIFYNGGKNSGIFSSNSTRRKGIITSQDFLPAVVHYFEINGVSQYVNNILILPSNNNIEYIKEINLKVTSISSSRVPLLRVFTLLIVVISLIYASSFHKFRNVNKAFLHFLSSFILIIPLSMLIEGIFRIEKVLYKGIFIFSLSAIASILLFITVKKAVHRIEVICGATISLLIIDICTGQKMLKYSILSYDPIIGARYYGLGNEYMGVLIGSVLVLSCLMVNEYNNKLYGLCLLIVVTLCIGLPQLGANIGGLLTSLIAIAIYLFFIYGINKKKSVIFCLYSSSLMLFLWLFIDNVFLKGATHFTNLINHAILSDKVYLLNITKRKILMEFQLIRYSLWSIVFTIFLIASLLFLFIPDYLIVSKFICFIKNKILIKLSLLTSIAALVLNDSGIISAAFVMMYCIFSLVLISSDGR